MFPTIYPSGASSNASASAIAVATASSNTTPYYLPSLPISAIQPYCPPVYMPACPPVYSPPIIPLTGYCAPQALTCQPSYYQPYSAIPTFGTQNYPSNYYLPSFPVAGYQQPANYYPSYGLNNFASLPYGSYGYGNYAGYPYNGYGSLYGNNLNGIGNFPMQGYGSYYPNSTYPSSYYGSPGYGNYGYNNINPNNYCNDCDSDQSALNPSYEKLSRIFPDGFRVTRQVQTKKGLALIGEGRLPNGKTKQFKVYTQVQSPEPGAVYKN